MTKSHLALGLAVVVIAAAVVVYFARSRGPAPHAEWKATLQKNDFEKSIERKSEILKDNMVALHRSYSTRAAMVGELIKATKASIPPQTKRIVDIVPKLSTATSDDLVHYDSIQNQISELIAQLAPLAKSTKAQEILKAISTEETRSRIHRQQYHRLAFELKKQRIENPNSESLAKLKEIPVFPVEAQLEEAISKGSIERKDPEVIQDPKLGK